MAAILIAYDTLEGQARRIALRLADLTSAAGHTPRLVSCRADALPLEDVDGVILAASIHAGRHSATARGFVVEHEDLLRRVPSGFLSVSLSAADPAKRDDARGYLAAFLEETGWRPVLTETLGGALAYRRYNFIKRWMMKSIADKSGLPTDTSRDHEYTDWDAVERFAAEFFQALADRPGAAGK